MGENESALFENFHSSSSKCPSTLDSNVSAGATSVVNRWSFLTTLRCLSIPVVARTMVPAVRRSEIAIASNERCCEIG